jgi:hypothetical protein
MPIHDWTRVPPGVFHDFHLAWVVEIQRCLNRGLLPDSHYALLELAAAPDADGMVRSEHEGELLAARRRRVVVRRSADDERVSSVEMVSPGKAYGVALNAMLDTLAKDLQAGFHVLIIDLFPPGNSDPNGTHAAVLRRLGGDYSPPSGKPLTLAAYAAAGAVTCYVEPTSVGAELIPMPLFLDPDHYINVPLEATYLGAYEGVPQRWKRVIEGAA